MTERADIIAQVCAALAGGDSAGAASIARAGYPFTPGANAGRRYTELQSLRVFWRDGFIDRYSGKRLVFPGTLRLLTQLLPSEFPAHPNWKMAESHIVYWELFPTVDHVIPVARGGVDDASNWVTTSMLRNSAKAHWTLEELGWHMVEPGEVSQWDGLTRWFTAYVAGNPTILQDAYVRRWHRAAELVLRDV